MRGCFHNRLVLGVAGAALLVLSGCSTFRITSMPAADIYEAGEKIGRTPYSFNLVSGKQTFVLKRHGYVEEEVVVTALDSKRTHVDLQWVGRTRIDSQPPGAEVRRLEDAELIGTTPCSMHLARPERVILRLKGYESVEYDLTPNESYVVELKPKAGFKSAFYKDIMFTSEQGSVEIYDRVAGERVGVTPVKLNLEAGVALEYRMSGHKPKQVLISRTAPPRVVIELEPYASVTLIGPEGAEVYRAGGVEKLGELPHAVSLDGVALFEIKKEGFRDLSLAVAPDSPKRLRVELEEIPYKTIVSEPLGAAVYRLGGIEKLGETPYETVVDGERIFEIKKKGFVPLTLGLGPDSPKSTKVPLAPAPSDDPDAAAIGSLNSESVQSF